MVTSLADRAEDVEAERGVILEEIAMHDDDPADVVHEPSPGSCSATRRSAGRSSARSSRSTRSPATQIAGYYRRRYTPPNLVVAAAGQRRPRRRSSPGPRGVRRRRSTRGGADAPRPAAGARRCPSGAGTRRAADRAADRAGEPRARVRGPVPERRPPVRARRAQRGARRRHVVPAVPGGPGEARAGLLGLHLHLASTPTPACGGVYAGCLPAKADEVLAICRDELAKVVRRRPDRRRARRAARASCAARSCWAWRTRRRG